MVQDQADHDRDAGRAAHLATFPAANRQRNGLEKRRGHRLAGEAYSIGDLPARRIGGDPGSGLFLCSGPRPSHRKSI